MNQIIYDNNRYEILGSNGWEDFKGLVVTEDDDIDVITIRTNSDYWIECTLSHRLYDVNDEEVVAGDLVIGDLVQSVDGLVEVIEITHKTVDRVYDIIDSDSHKIYTNGIKNHQCDEFAFVEPSWKADEFWASNYPTISASKESKIIIISTPNGLYNKFHEIYSKAEEGKNTFKNARYDYTAVPGRDEEWAKEQIQNLGKIKFNQEFGCFSRNSLININNTITGQKESVTIGELYERIENEHLQNEDSGT